MANTANLHERKRTLVLPARTPTEESFTMTANWTEVAHLALFWGGLMFVSNGIRRVRAGIKRLITVQDVVSWSALGFFFGILVVFGWSAVRTPLLFVTCASLILGIAA